MIEDLVVKIEKKRQHMIELGLSTSFHNEHVVKVSSQLDQLLNTYDSLTRN